MTTTDEPRGLYDQTGACWYLSIGLTKFKELVREREIERVYIGAAPRFTRKSLDAYIARLSRRAA